MSLNSLADSEHVRLDSYISKGTFTRVNLLRCKSGRRYKHNVGYFISIEFKPQTGRASVSGYVPKSAKLQEVFSTLIQDKTYNQHIKLIEWDTHFLLLCEDGMYISRKGFFVTKESVYKMIAESTESDYALDN